MRLRFIQPLPCILHLYQLESSPLAERTLSVYNATWGKGLDLQTRVGVKRGEIYIKSRQILFFLMFECVLLPLHACLVGAYAAQTSRALISRVRSSFRLRCPYSEGDSLILS